MASNKQQTKGLDELTETEVQVFLRNLKFQIIAEKLQSSGFGEVDGDLIENLDDETLESIEIKIPLQRKRFLKSMKKHKCEGVRLELLIPNDTKPKEVINVPETEYTVAEIHKTPSLSTKVKDRTKLHALLNKSEKLQKKCSSEMDIYGFPAKKMLVEDVQQPLYGNNLKKIIIMGETGTGKSTLLNAFVNYAAGVEIEDPFRFRLVLDEEDRACDQAISQTSEISGYHIDDTLLGFPIQIWDTPGFGDTSGIERDEEIKTQINELLNHEDFCHAICFVVKANANRLTDTQKYIIDRILLFFGKEAEENIYLLATFAEDGRPAVLHSFEKSNNYPYNDDRWFAFNNGSLYKSASETTVISRSYWDETKNSMENFFKVIGEVEAFSLTSTKEIIEQRENLAQELNAITSQAITAAYKKEVFEQNLSFLESLEVNTRNTVVYTEVLPKTTVSKIDTDSQNTICKNCNNNCHIGCRTMGMVFCGKFNWDLSCKRCGCQLMHHHKVFYKYEVVVGTYEVSHVAEEGEVGAKMALVKYEQAKASSEQNKKQEHAKLANLIERIQTRIIEIDKLAILNYSFDTMKYFERLIKKEEEENNFEKADAYRKLCRQENIIMNFTNHPYRTAKRLLSSETNEKLTSQQLNKKH